MSPLYAVGHFAVIDRGDSVSYSEFLQHRPRYMVVEFDAHGPIMRAGPCQRLGDAVEICNALHREKNGVHRALRLVEFDAAYHWFIR